MIEHFHSLHFCFAKMCVSLHFLLQDTAVCYARRSQNCFKKHFLLPPNSLLNGKQLCCSCTFTLRFSAAMQCDTARVRHHKKATKDICWQKTTTVTNDTQEIWKMKSKISNALRLLFSIWRLALKMGHIGTQCLLSVKSGNWLHDWLKSEQPTYTSFDTWAR